MSLRQIPKYLINVGSERPSDRLLRVKQGLIALDVSAIPGEQLTAIFPTGSPDSVAGRRPPRRGAEAGGIGERRAVLWRDSREPTSTHPQSPLAFILGREMGPAGSPRGGAQVAASDSGERPERRGADDDGARRGR